MCGIGFIRLRQPYQYYLDKYGSVMYPLQKLYLLMDKQSNRGQDGAGVAVIKLDVPPGYRYISRYRSTKQDAIHKIFKKIAKKIKKTIKNHKDKALDAQWLKENVAFTGELLLGHLRYGTHGLNTIENCHPFLRQNNWRSRNLVLAGNFNMTNADFLFNRLVELGQHPRHRTDTETILERIGHFLDEENQVKFNLYKHLGYTNIEISEQIAKSLDLQHILKRSAKHWDGGYVMGGIIGHGDAFIARDPHGIRPAFYYEHEDYWVIASERPAISTTFNVPIQTIQEVPPAHAIIIKYDGNFQILPFTQEQEKRSCSFERIYFSRGNDPDIYHERKALGKILVPEVLKSIQHDIENTVFSYIP
ncbi:MAG: class II glutamine amidotransferase, partial [Bacteroidia bacterium]|nr:class II glutamine amidotransferase [Bacteroidia bacterium]